MSEDTITCPVCHEAAETWEEAMTKDQHGVVIYRCQQCYSYFYFNEVTEDWEVVK